MKKFFILIFTMIFIGFMGFHFYLNLQQRRLPPSQQYAKEVKISSGDVNFNPRLIKYKNNYIVGHDDGNNIKIVEVDPLGKVIQEKSFFSEGKEPSYVNVITDGDNIYLNWLMTIGTKKNVVSLKLDSKFNTLEKSYEYDVNEKTQIDVDVLLIGYRDRIEFKNFKTGAKIVTPTKNAALITGVKYKNKYFITYQGDFGDWEIYSVENDIATKPKVGGRMYEISRMNFFSTAFVTDGVKGYILGEYKFQQNYAGTKMLEFSLEGGNYKFYDLHPTGTRSPIGNVVASSDNNQVKFLAVSERAYGRKEVYTDIIEMKIVNQKISAATPVSRTKSLSGYPASYGDTIIYCDFYKEGESAVYMTSSREDFKKANNGPRTSEMREALMDTLQSGVAAIAYTFTYGVLWIIPCLCLVSVFCLVEYKLQVRGKKIAFVLIYISSIITKLVAVNFVSFKMYRFFMPEFITPTIGLGICAVVGVLCGIYGYKIFAKDTAKNVIALSFSYAMIIDTVLTLAFVVPFLV